MPGPRALFLDIGGVVLTNGWDRGSRRQAAHDFSLDWEQFEHRHELAVPAFDKGQLSLQEYLDRTVFYEPRGFTREEFRQFMLAQSQPFPDTLALVRRLAHSTRYLFGTLNNESTELNLYRIERFNLRDYFDVFFSSCFLGARKPEEAIYSLALQMTQCAPREFVFVDDRPVNLESARGLGIRALQFQSAAQLEQDLRGVGIEV